MNSLRHLQRANILAARSQFASKKCEPYQAWPNDTNDTVESIGGLPTVDVRGSRDWRFVGTIPAPDAKYFRPGYGYGFIDPNTVGEFERIKAA